MRKVISIMIEHPDCSTSGFREKLYPIIKSEFQTEIYDMWDSEDERPKPAQDVSGIVSQSIYQGRDPVIMGYNG